VVFQADGGDVFAVIANRAGAVPIDFGGTVVRFPGYADGLFVGVFFAAIDAGDQLHKKDAFIDYGEVKDLVFFIIAFSTLKGTVSAFVSYIGNKQFFQIWHQWRLSKI